MDEPTIRTASDSAANVTAFQLRVTAGPDAGTVFTISGGMRPPVSLGKSRCVDLVLTDGTVSRRHASFEVTSDRMRVTDLRSTNGTFVNGIRIDSAWVSGGETLRIGQTNLGVQTVSEGRAATPLPGDRFGRILGESPEMRRLFPLCERLSQTDVSIILEGETGTGKEVLAESIHDASARAQGPFVVFDCTTVAPTLLEAALFGHEKGAFTGAITAKPGVFEQAHGGTLLIDEIGDLDVALQAKLLRAIERSEVRRVGGTSWIKFDVRVLCATRRDLERLIQESRFRDDLFYRLAVARIELPPLRARQGDVPVLVRHFWTALGGKIEDLPADLLERMSDYHWPGNVRELHNSVAHRLALGDLANLESLRRQSKAPQAASETSLEALVENAVRSQVPYARARDLVISEFSRRYCDRMLEAHGGKVTKAAAAAGIGRRYFYTVRGEKIP